MEQMTHSSIFKNGPYRGLTIDGLDDALLLRLHEFMLRLRTVELALIEEYHPADEMRCPVHFCVGQEAVPAALSSLLRTDDYMFSHHRTHGYYLAKGAPLNALFAELYGKSTGANGGTAGSQDISYSPAKFYSGAILAGAVGLAVGAAFGLKFKKSDNVAVAGFGEGATDEGIFWEAVNYAALRKLPILFMCENNRFATYSAQQFRQPQDNLSAKVAAFGIKAQNVFGNDATALYRVLSEALVGIRNGEGPQFIQAYTYRWNSHVGPEDDSANNYRAPGELDFWKKNCPILLLEERLENAGKLTASAKQKLAGSIDAEIKGAFKFAKTSPFPESPIWRELNTCNDSPLADKLLKDTEHGKFNQNQADALPGPY